MLFQNHLRPFGPLSNGSLFMLLMFMFLKSILGLYRSRQNHKGVSWNPITNYDHNNDLEPVFFFLHSNFVEVQLTNKNGIYSPCGMLCLDVCIQSRRAPHAFTAHFDKHKHLQLIKPPTAPHPAFQTSGEVKVYSLFRDSKRGSKFHSEADMMTAGDTLHLLCEE